MTLPDRIRITEVGPRDGLQNEKETIATADKAAMISLLLAAGFPEIEVTSFVSPKWVPQLADGDVLLPMLPHSASTIYSALVPNEQGLARALAVGIRKVAVFTSASEGFSRRNTNGSIAEVMQRLKPVVATARNAKLPVRGYISCVIACPFDGETPPQMVREVAMRLFDLGVDEIDLGDTIGVAAPPDIDRLYEGLDGVIPPSASTLHLHDTRGTALACALRAMQLGVVSFDSSCGGLGGCPYAPGAAGNLATEDLVYLCRRSGIQTGIDLAALFAAGRHIQGVLGRALRGRVFAADGNASSASRSTGAGLTS